MISFLRQSKSCRKLYHIYGFAAVRGKLLDHIDRFTARLESNPFHRVLRNLSNLIWKKWTEEYLHTA
ncbi:hypothetical protein D3C87_2014060 [compost metagenome]